MQVYDILVTRTVTESAIIVLEGASEVEARAAALARAKSDTDLVWETDDVPPTDHFISNCDEVCNA